MTQEACILCSSVGGVEIVRTAHFRVVRATDQPLFPLTYRVIWGEHVTEFSDLTVANRHLCTDAVAWLEAAMRRFLQPNKMNLAALGNVVPHLHWHVIARYHWDSTFPAPVWGQAVREVDPKAWGTFAEKQQKLEDYLRENIHQLA